MEDIGHLTCGTLTLTENSINFIGDKGGKSVYITGTDVDKLKWQKLGNKPGLRVGLSDGGAHRFGGFLDDVSLLFVFFIFIRL